MDHTLTAPEPLFPSVPSAQRRHLPATTVSLALHLGILAALCWMVRPPPLPAPSPPPSFAMVMEPAPAPPATQALEAKTLPPSARTEPLTLATPRPLSLTTAEQGELHRPRRPAPRHLPVVARAEPALPPAPSAAPAKPEAAADPPPAAPAAVSANALSSLRAKIHQAVQEATIYPPAARLMHREGRAQVRFDYAGGAAANISLAQSSDSAMLDEAAIAAVRRAAMPPPPPEIGARKLDLVVWVDFSLVRQN